MKKTSDRQSSAHEEYSKVIMTKEINITSERNKASSEAFMNADEYKRLVEESAGAILAFRAGEYYDFYGLDVKEVIGSNPSLAEKVSTHEFPDGTSVETVRVPREELYSNLEALLDYENGMLGLVFMDRPGEKEKTEEVSITAAYDKWFERKVDDGKINVLMRGDQFQAFGEDVEKVNELLGVTEEELLEDIFASEYRHDISQLSELKAAGAEVNAYDYSAYVQENMQKEKSMMDKLAQQTSIISSKQITGSNGEITYNDEIAKVVNDRRQKVFARQAELLSNALSKCLKGSTVWLNQNYKKYPQVFYSASQKPVTPSPFHALMMCLHSDAEDSVYNDYTTYYAAKSAGTPVISGEHGVPLVFDATIGYINKENKSDSISKEEYLFLTDAEKGKFERVTTTGIRTMFNIDQTADIAVRDEVFFEENGRPPIKNYERFTKDERSNLQMKFNDFLLKMKDNLVPIDISDKGTCYSKTKDLVIIADWKDQKESIRRGEDDYPYYMQHSIRQIVEATGSEQRLNRLARLERNGDVSKEDAQKQEELIVELASAVKMMEYGLPGELTPWSQLKNIDYWTKELKENPQLIGTLEKEVNSSLRMIRKAELGESIKLHQEEKQQQEEKKAKVQDPSYPMLKQYNSLKQKHPDAILLFRMGDFYEAYQDDAQVAAKILDITLTRRKDKNGGSVQMAGFPYHALDTYLPKLIRAGERVAICDPKPIEKITPAQKLEAQEEVAEAEIESRQHSMRR